MNYINRVRGRMYPRSLNTNIAWLLVALALLMGRPAAAPPEKTPTPADLLAQVGIPPDGRHRGQMDIVGFASNAVQMDAVLDQCRRLAAAREDQLRRRYGWADDTHFVAAVCPHDDYGYAGRLYQLVLPRITAKRVVIFGVFHKARVFDCRDRLIFDDFRTWRGPYGAVPVSGLRAAILQQLEAADYRGSNDMHMVEHSVEAIVPWLQAVNRDVEIVPILVPYMDWSTMQTLSDRLSTALADICRRNGWEPGRDLAVVVSCDAVHYGDEGWGGSDYAAFGTDVLGYQQAVRRDRDMAENMLCGPVMPDKLRDFLYTCVDGRDVTQYQVTWCGRFSVPLGLEVARRLVRQLKDRPLTGYLLDYGTSVSEATLDLSAAPGMGFTAPNNFHHFVGYAAIGYR